MPHLSIPDLADGLAQCLQGARVVLHERHVQLVLRTLRQGGHHRVGLLQKHTVLPVPRLVADQLLGAQRQASAQRPCNQAWEGAGPRTPYLEQGLVLLDPLHGLLQEVLQGRWGRLRRVCGRQHLLCVLLWVPRGAVGDRAVSAEPETGGWGQQGAHGCRPPPRLAALLSHRTCPHPHRPSSLASRTPAPLCHQWKVSLGLRELYFAQ